MNSLNSLKTVLAIVAVCLVSGCEMAEFQKAAGQADGSSSDATSVDSSSVDSADASVDASPTQIPTPATVVDEDLDGDHYTGAFDCDESDPSINKGAVEVCDGKDNNCDGQTDEGVTEPRYLDADKDGYGTSADPIQICKGEPTPHGYVEKAGDCNDSTAIKGGKVVGYFINPGAEEVCDGVDNNCNGEIDEGLVVCQIRKKSADPIQPPADSTVVASGDFLIVVAYAEEATRTISVEQSTSEAEVGKKGWGSTNTSYGVNISELVHADTTCYARFNVSWGDSQTTSLCLGNNSSAKIDPSVTVYKVILATNLWIDVTKEVVTWSDPAGNGCSAELKKLKATCK